MSPYQPRLTSYTLSLPGFGPGKPGAGNAEAGAPAGAGLALGRRLPAQLPLADVWSTAVRKGGILAGREAANGRLASLADQLLPVDAEWQQSLSNPRPYLACLANVVVIPGSRILLDEDGGALSDEIEYAHRRFALRPKNWDLEIADGPLLKFGKPQTLGAEILEGIHLMGEHEANYFHWVAEVLPRIHLYQLLTRERELPLLISDGLHENLYQLLRMVCGAGRPTIRLQAGRCVRVGRLTYPSDVSMMLDFYDRPPSHETTYLPVGLLKDMVKAVRAALPHAADDGARRLFVRRAATYRKLLNDDEVEGFLVARGFVPVDPGALPVDRQIALFSQADIVVGPSGAAMTNMIWCRSQARVLILHSDHPFKKYPYWDALARVAGARISYLAGPRAHNVQGQFEVHDDYRIPVAALAAAVADIEGPSTT